MAKVPPKYDDLGKECRDVFGKGYGKLCKKSAKVCDFTFIFGLWKTMKW